MGLWIKALPVLEGTGEQHENREEGRGGVIIKIISFILHNNLLKQGVSFPLCEGEN